jgi:RNA-directed DNA polymerase
VAVGATPTSREIGSRGEEPLLEDDREAILGFSGILLTGKGESITVDLMKAVDVRIERHMLIQHEANPYDPLWDSYYEERLQHKMESLFLGRLTLRVLYQRQKGRCLGCGELFNDPREWHLHHRQWRVYGGDESWSNLELLHGNCHRQIHNSVGS